MALVQMNLKSQILGKYIDVSIVIPTDRYSYCEIKEPPRDLGANKGLPIYTHEYKKGMKFQVIYIPCAGAPDDSLELRYTAIERYAQENHVMLVLPSMASTWAVNTASGERYSDFLNDELPVWIETMFPASDKREDTFIGGQGQLGSAALYNALKRPDRYAACVDIEGGRGPSFNNEMAKKETRLFGDPDKFDGSEYDLHYLAKRNVEAGVELPKFIIAAGELSFSGDTTQKQKCKCLQDYGYEAEYKEIPALGHDWRAFDDGLRLMMEEWLGLKHEPIYPKEK